MSFFSNAAAHKPPRLAISCSR